MDLMNSNYVSSLSTPVELELRHIGTGKKFSEHGGNDLFVMVLGSDSEPVEKARISAQRKMMKSVREKSESTSASEFEISVACAAIVGFRGGSGSVQTLDEFKNFLRNHPDGKFYARQILRFSESSENFFESPPSS